MPKWEYNLVPWADLPITESGNSLVLVENVLNGVGDEGWELVGHVLWDGEPLLFFKRPK